MRKLVLVVAVLVACGGNEEDPCAIEGVDALGARLSGPYQITKQWTCSGDACHSGTFGSWMLYTPRSFSADVETTECRHGAGTVTLVSKEGARDWSEHTFAVDVVGDALLDSAPPTCLGGGVPPCATLNTFSYRISGIDGIGRLSLGVTNEQGLRMTLSSEAVGI